MLDVLGQDYILMARAKGASSRRVLFHHALRNALIPLITYAGLQASILVGGSVLVENVFSWPGIGTLAYEAVAARDNPLLLGIFIVTAILVAFIADDHAGALLEVLTEFAVRGVNLTRIESRPRRQGLGSYMFFVDLDGRVGDQHVIAALAAVRDHAEVVRVTGSFPAARG